MGKPSFMYNYLKYREKQNEELERRKKINQRIQSVNESANIPSVSTKKHDNFYNDVTKTLVFECLYNLLDESCKDTGNYNDTLRKSIIANYVEEAGAGNILSSMKGKTYVLSEFYRIINEHKDNIIKESKKKDDDNEEFELDIESKDNFYKDLKTKDAKDLSATIKNRVSTALDEFITQNSKEMMEIKDIINKSQEKANSVKPESANDSDIQEATLIQEAIKRRHQIEIKSVKQNRSKNILESIIGNIATATMTNKILQESYIVEGKLDLDSVVENATTMYAFLEMLNASKLETIDSKYIEKTLSELK